MTKVIGLFVESINVVGELKSDFDLGDLLPLI